MSMPNTGPSRVSLVSTGARISTARAGRPRHSATAAWKNGLTDCSMAGSGGYDSSLSGLKTAVLRHVKAERAAGRAIDPADLAASFQEAIVDVQVSKTIAAAKEKGVDTVLLGGGVVANSRLRERMEGAGSQAGLRVLFPTLELCTDNGAMIAAAGATRLARGERTGLDVGADPGLELR